MIGDILRTAYANNIEGIDDKERIISEFNAAWPRLLSEILEDDAFKDIRDSMIWLNHVLNQNVPFGKKNRALIGIFVYFELTKDRELNDEDKYLCYVSGWCAEIMQAAALIADDIMDGSEERRGKPCWYTRNDVGASALNDAFLLENLVYHIMWKYFSKEVYFLRFLRLIMDTGFKTMLGQSSDTRLCLDSTDFSKFTLTNYKAIVKYKTSYYSFYAPVAVALIRAEITDPVLFDSIEELALEMGYLFQVQDDFLDCFGDSQYTGKVGTDIIDRKCTWLIVTALECATEAQRNELMKCYGGKITNDAVTVQRIYEELKIEKLYRKHEDKIYNDISAKIDQLPKLIPKYPLTTLLQKMYKRNK